MKYLFSLISLLLLASCGSVDTLPISEIPKTEKIILALGDSLTAGYGLPESENYPTQLEAKLRAKSYNYRIINAWISGDTTDLLLARLDWILDGSGSIPSLAILCIGANDAFQAKSVIEIEKNIRTIIESLQSKNIPILFAGMKAPLNLGGEYGWSYEAIFPKLAKEYKLPFMPFFLEGVALKGSLNQEDRIHPNRSGYALIVENLMKILEDEKLIIQ
jgi:acyl-CoA thioesterase I